MRLYQIRKLLPFREVTVDYEKILFQVLRKIKHQNTMITKEQFYKVCTRLGFKVFKDYPYKRFYKVFYDDYKEDINFTLARLIVFETGNEVTLFRPKKYSFFSPSTFSTDKTYTDIDEFEKDLIENYFILRKYWFEYNMRKHSI